LIIGAYSIMMMGIYQGFDFSPERIAELIALYPEAMAKAFGADRLNLAEPVGFYAMGVYLMVVLFGGIFAALLGSGILAKEEEEKTVEFLLAKPVSRISMLWQKAVALVISLAALNIGVAACTFLAFAVFVKGGYPVAALLRLAVAPFFAHLAFASIGFLSALFFTKRRTVYAVSTGVTMGTYFIGLMSLMSDKLAPLRWIAPTRYVEAVDIVADGSLHPAHLAILTAVSILALGATFVLYRRRDITV
jgi:ABC-2 type transport system permease protein